MDIRMNTPPNILVVDDVNTNLVFLSDMLRNAGFMARPVTNVTQALNAIDAITPNLILLDISMPDIDGYEFCSMLKRNAKTRDIPVIFITALHSKESRLKGFRAGAVDYIEKPFDQEELTLRINTHIKMHKMIQEQEVYNKKLYKIINNQIQKIYESQKNLILTIALILGKQDPIRENHMMRVGKNSKRLAMGMQLSGRYRNLITNSFIDAIELASLLHDFSRDALLGDFIYTQESLTEEIKAALMTHTSMGAATMEEILIYHDNNEFLNMAIDIIRSHHEFWNGEGYPLGISGEKIPLSARIVAVIDAYDTLTNENVMQNTYSHEQSMEKINQNAGIIFDPDIVSIFNMIQH